MTLGWPPYKEAIEGRYQYVVNKEKNLTGNGRQTLSEMASGISLLRIA